MKEKTRQLVLITGGTSGIGLAAAACVARDGYTPVLLGRNPERGREAEQKVQHEGYQSGGKRSRSYGADRRSGGCSWTIRRRSC